MRISNLTREKNYSNRAWKQMSGDIADLINVLVMQASFS
jgi:hypothetical protein